MEVLVRFFRRGWLPGCKVEEDEGVLAVNLGSRLLINQIGECVHSPAVPPLRWTPGDWNLQADTRSFPMFVGAIYQSDLPLPHYVLESYTDTTTVGSPGVRLVHRK
jgi:hypothetical protein